MTNGEAINWIINISADIGKAKHRDLWHYEQALSEIKEMLESAEPERKRGKWLPYLPKGLRYKCSECGSRYDTPWNFCPECGSHNGGENHDKG